MKEKNTEREWEASPTWDELEAFARQGIQRLLQRVLEEEVDRGLGRGRYERRAAVDARPGYRNGYGKPQRLSVMVGTVTVRRPRVRGLEERFESRLLPLFKRRTEAVVGSCSRRSPCMGWPPGTSTWRCEGCWARGRRCRRRRSPA